MHKKFIRGKKERTLRENGKRAGRSRESLQTPCESDSEGRKKGKLFTVLQKFLQGRLGDLQPKSLIRGILSVQMGLLKYISGIQLLTGSDPQEVQPCNKLRDEWILEHSSWGPWEIVHPAVPDLRDTHTHTTAQTQQNGLN